MKRPRHGRARSRVLWLEGARLNVPVVPRVRSRCLGDRCLAVCVFVGSFRRLGSANLRRLNSRIPNERNPIQRRDESVDKTDPKGLELIGSGSGGSSNSCSSKHPKNLAAKLATSDDGGCFLLTVTGKERTFELELSSRQERDELELGLRAVIASGESESRQ